MSRGLFEQVTVLLLLQSYCCVTSHLALMTKHAPIPHPNLAAPLKRSASSDNFTRARLQLPSPSRKLITHPSALKRTRLVITSLRITSHRISSHLISHLYHLQPPISLSPTLLLHQHCSSPQHTSTPLQSTCTNTRIPFQPTSSTSKFSLGTPGVYSRSS